MRPLTPIRQHKNILIKMEALQPSGSHKARAARHIIKAALASGDLIAGGPRRLLEKSGGNLGVGLAFEAARFGIQVDLVIGLSFSPIKRMLCERYGANLVGQDLLHAGLSPKEAIAQLMANDPDRWFFSDQFRNASNLTAHFMETGAELVQQIKMLRSPNQKIILVKGAGTGASFEGIARRLTKAFEAVAFELVVPIGCDFLAGKFIDHPLEGFAVGVTPPFLDLKRMRAIHAISPADALDGQNHMARDIGFFPGMTSGANYAAARRVAEANQDALIVTVAYDSGESYLRVPDTGSEAAKQKVQLENA